MKKSTKQILWLFFALHAFTHAYSQDIAFSDQGLYPEGTAYSARQDVFFVSSIHYGKIGKVDRKGHYSTFIDDTALVTTVGILADEKRNLLYVAIADNGLSTRSTAATAGKLSMLAAYDLVTGKRRFIANLGALYTEGGNFANDITVDAAGNLYVTNSYSPVIFKVTQQGKASIFASNKLWQGEGYNLNGIVYTRGYLIVAQSNTGLLYKINTSNPKDIITIQAPVLKGADGLILKGNNELVIASHASYQVYQLTTADNWKSATIKNTTKAAYTFPTTGVLAKGKYYILNAKLDEFFNNKAPKTANFLLQQVNF